jgi:glutathione synthase/RimK-type ligase-like ATP-grasp enzyme
LILLWGLRQDRPMARVLAELERRDVPHAFVDQRAVLDSEIELDAGAVVGGTIRVAGRSVDLAAVTAAYVRPYDAWRIGAVARAGRDSPELRHALAFDDTLWLWSELTAARVLNRPSKMAGNQSKPYQAQTIGAHGFRVPDTLLTTDADAVRAFRERHGSVVYKSISGTRSVVSRLSDEDETRIADVAWCPTQFQQYVPGDDHRVHVVGDEVFCARIASQADDYRYSARQGASLSMTTVQLDDDCARRCRELADALGLRLAGIDLRLTPAGEWFCFEVNPSPAFTYYDRDGQGIAEAVTRLLSDGVEARDG